MGWKEKLEIANSRGPVKDIVFIMRSKYSDQIDIVVDLNIVE